MPELFASEYPAFTRKRLAAAKDGPQVFTVRKDDKGRAVVRTMIESAKSIDLAAPYSGINFYDLRHVLNHLQRKRGVQMRAIFYGQHDAFDLDVVGAFAEAAGEKARVRHIDENFILAEALIVDKIHVLTLSQDSLMAVFNDPQVRQQLTTNFGHCWLAASPIPLRL